MLGVKRFEVPLEPHDEDWVSQFNIARKEILATLGANVKEVYHIGSTAIKGVLAKPIIDIAVSVRNLRMLDTQSMELMGYLCMGEMGVPGRIYFVKRCSADIRAQHIYCYEEDHDCLVNSILFRDYLNSHPGYAEQYSELKQKLFEELRFDSSPSKDEKTSFIKMVISLARMAYEEEPLNKRVIKHGKVWLGKVM